MRIRAVILTVVVASGLLSACGGSSSKKSGNGSGSFEQAQPVTRQDKILAQTTDEGFLPKDAALQLFALQYGPLPGVSVPKGTNGPATDGNLAIANVFRVWNELTPEQQTKIREYLETPPDFTPGGPGKARRFDPPSAAAYQAAADTALPALERHFGALGIPVRVVASRGTVIVDGQPAFADTLVERGTCRIRAFTRYFSEPTGVSETMIHELFHCYQFVWTSNRLGMANWVIEGTAEWVGATIAAELGAGPDATATGFLQQWYATPHTALFRRSYDAIGFFALAQQSGVDVMGRLRSVVTARTNAGAYGALGRSGTGFGTEWAMTQTDQPRFGSSWFLRGSGIPSVPNASADDAFYRSQAQSLGNGQRDTVTAPAYTTARVVVGLDADLTRFNASATTGGTARLGLTQDKSLSELRDGPYCTARDLNRCRCPEGTPQAGRTFPAITAGPTILVIGGAEHGASLEVVGTSLEDECGVPRPCPVGTWKMNTLPTGLPFTPTSGGTGKVLTIAADGRLVQSFAEYVTMNGEKNGAVFFVEARGQLTGRIAIPADNPRPTGMRVTDVDANGITGIERITFPDGQTMEISGPDFTAVASALADLGRTATINCAAPNTLTVTAGGITETYSPR
jgi:hypothetical protein